MTRKDKVVLIELAKRAVKAAAGGTPPPDIPDEGVCSLRGGAFVTLKKNGRLRGCIGHFTGLGSLCETVRAMAVEAAVSDPRFPPVSPHEVGMLSIEISVLSPMKRIDADEVVPGVHGLYIRRGGRAGTLLPQVATEEGWDREMFLRHTCIKAGLPPDAYRHGDTEIYAYTAEVFGDTESQGEIK